MTNYVHKGKTLSFLAPYNVNSGGGFLVGNIFAIAATTALSGTALEGDVVGVFDIAKDASTFTQGAIVYWNNTTLLCTSSPLTAAGVANFVIGYTDLVQASGTNALGGSSGDATVRARLSASATPLITSADLDPSLLQKATVVLSAANLIAMNGAPISVLPAPAAGQVILVDQISVQFKPGGTQFTGGGAVTFVYHGGSVNPHAGNIPAATITSASASNNVLAPPAATYQPPTATGIDVTNATAAFATGNGTAIVTLYYTIVTLG